MASDALPQDPSAPPGTWREGASDLSSRLGEAARPSSGGGRAAAVAIEKACSDVLRASSSGSGQDGDGRTGDALPDDVRSVVTAAYLRAMIKLGKHGAVVDHCRRRDDDAGSSGGGGDHAEEVAYSLYRLRKYEACRRFCAEAGAGGGGGDGGGGSGSRGLMHVHAQALYRLGETTGADSIYRRLLANGDDDEGEAMDADEREDALANALANRTANYTPGSLLLGTSGRNWLEEDDTLQQLLASYGTAPADDNEEGELLQNYDLAYNLATYLLVSNDARSRSNVAKARQLLEAAETSALTILESSSANDASPSDEGDEDEDEAARVVKEVARRKKQQEQQQLAEREAGPIRANLALARLLQGGEENETEALRGCLALLMKAAKSKKGGAGQANLTATASNNLALLRDGKESIFDVAKRVPTTSSLSVSENNIGSTAGKGGSRGGKDRGGGTASSAVLLAGATPQQARVALSNRALLLARMGNAGGCAGALRELRASLLVSYRGDDDGGGRYGEGKSEGGGGASSSRRSKGKKKKEPASAANPSLIENGNKNNADVPTAKPASEVEAIAWNARADWIESELRRMTSESSSSKDALSAQDILNKAIAKLDEAIQQNENTDEEALGVLPFAKSQLMLHTSTVSNSQRSKASFIEALESLPPAVQAYPGTKITLASLYTSTNNGKELAEKLILSLGEDTPAKLAVAEFHMERGQYKDAIQLLEGIAEEDSASSTEVTALLVKALSYTDPSKAEDYVGQLQQAMMSEAGGKELDGEALESMEIPRFAKKALGTKNNGGKGAVGGSSSRIRKMIAATGGNKRGSNQGEQKEKNRESALRKRAKQREAYLSRLQSEGRYDPSKTPLPKPDPERWIPKSQRSYNRRGRGRGRHKSNVGAQGGGAGAGMEKDAARLDVAARATSARSGVGGDGTGGRPSTANIKVSSSGASRKGKGGRRR